MATLPALRSVSTRRAGRSDGRFETTKAGFSSLSATAFPLGLARPSSNSPISSSATVPFSAGTSWTPHGPAQKRSDSLGGKFPSGVVKQKAPKSFRIMGFAQKMCQGFESSVPRPLALQPLEAHTASLAQIMWQPQLNPRAQRGTGLLARLERLRQAAMEIHRGVQRNRSSLVSLRQEIPSTKAPALPAPLLEQPPPPIEAVVQLGDWHHPSVGPPPAQRWLADISITIGDWEEVTCIEDTKQRKNRPRNSGSSSSVAEALGTPKNKDSEGGQRQPLLPERQTAS